jgi:hypothetical protein
VRVEQLCPEGSAFGCVWRVSGQAGVFVWSGAAERRRVKLETQTATNVETNVCVCVRAVWYIGSTQTFRRTLCLSRLLEGTYFRPLGTCLPNCTAYHPKAFHVNVLVYWQHYYSSVTCGSRGDSGQLCPVRQHHLTHSALPRPDIKQQQTRRANGLQVCRLLCSGLEAVSLGECQTFQ